MSRLSAGCTFCKVSASLKKPTSELNYFHFPPFHVFAAVLKISTYHSSDFFL